MENSRHDCQKIMMEDPFFVVKDEVFKALNKTRGLYLRWRELNDALSGGTTAEAEWTTTELKNSLRSIEWDLEDLEDTISIVEKNPNKFKIDNKELSSRRQFIDATRDEVKSMKDACMIINRNRDRDITARQPLLDNCENGGGSPHQQSKNFINNNCIIGNGSSGGTQHHGNNTLNNNNLNLSGTGKHLISSAGAAMASRHSGAKYSKLENNLDDSPTHSSAMMLDSGSSRFVEDTLGTQQRIMASQDEQLDVISDSIGTLKTVSRQIGIELDEQAVMLDEFGNELEQTDSKLDSTMKKVAKVLHMTNDRRQWMAIVTLSITLLVVIVIYIIL